MRFYNTEAKGSGNEVSLIVELVYKQQRFLFMGCLLYTSKRFDLKEETIIKELANQGA